MAVTIGARPDSGFDDPIGLLGDCHRRIEHFLGVLVRLAGSEETGPLTPEHARALKTALLYFDEAAPRHSEDEEHSLFPRLRRRGDREALELLDRIERLERDHARAEASHRVVSSLGAKWLEDGVLSAEDRETLRGTLKELRGLYAAHIRVEDEEVFPAAARLLSASQLEDVGREMAARRGLRPPLAGAQESGA